MGFFVGLGGGGGEEGRLDMGRGRGLDASVFWIFGIGRGEGMEGGGWREEGGL
jgi:hypothetical protein